jgi:hypothetical protein
MIGGAPVAGLFIIQTSPATLRRPIIKMLMFIHFVFLFSAQGQRYEKYSAQRR